MTLHYSRLPHLYGLPKIHKWEVSLKSITISRNSPTSALFIFLLRFIQKN